MFPFVSYRSYLEDESKNKKGVPLDMSNWSLITAKDIPIQDNGSDCGVFMSMVSVCGQEWSQNILSDIRNVEKFKSFF